MDLPYIGEIRLFPYETPDGNWMPCNGQSLPKTAKVFEVISYQFGGSGNRFNLPDLRARVPFGTSVAYPQGVYGGANTVTLTEGNMPVHTHALNVSTTPATLPGAVGNLLATTADNEFIAPAAREVPMSAGSINVPKPAAPINNMQPFLGLGYYIAVSGVFPTRP